MTIPDPRRKLLPVSLLLLLLGCSPHLLASDCEITLSSQHLDYGPQQHPSGAVTPQARHLLDRREVRLNANCLADSAIELSLHGPVQSNRMKFSDQGQVSIQMSRAQLDGRPVGLARLSDLGATGGGLESLASAPGDIIVPVEGGLPARGKSLVLSLEIVPELPLSDMRSRDAKTHEGQLRIDVSAT